jgi:hypothetical protein
MSKIKDMFRKARDVRGGTYSTQYTGIDPKSRAGTNKGGTTAPTGPKGRRRPGPGVGPARTPLSPQPVMRAPR